jgi:CheY-like chemotaxis protein
MISQCPHCQQALNFTAGQLAKIEKALAALQPGKVLKLGCPQCKQTIELEPGASERVLEDILYTPEGGKPAPKKRIGPAKPPPNAPQPPDLGWLAKGDFESGESWLEDVLTAMLLLPEGEGRAPVVKAFEDLGYQVVIAKSSADAIERLRFANYSAIVYHTAFENGGLEASSFHRHMRGLAMDKRRHLLYVLLGPDFKTFYDLEAQAHSANLVVNDRELRHMPVILKKGLHDHETLFNPLIMMLREYGKR